jgi:hypothetical protein
LREVRKRDVEGICACGYLTLRPSGSFEESNGGLTVKRTQVRIVGDDGGAISRLRGVNRYRHCNACVNDWK